MPSGYSGIRHVRIPYEITSRQEVSNDAQGKAQSDNAQTRNARASPTQPYLGIRNADHLLAS